MLKPSGAREKNFCIERTSMIYRSRRFVLHPVKPRERRGRASKGDATTRGPSRARGATRGRARASADASKSSRRRIGRPREGARGGGADADGHIDLGGRGARRAKKKTNPDGMSVGVDDVSSSPRDGVAGMPRVSASRDRSSRKANGDAIRSWLKDASAAGPEDEARRDLDGRDDSVPRGRRGAADDRSTRSFVSIDRSFDRSIDLRRRRASSSSRRPRDTLNRNPKPPTYPTPSVHPAELSKEDVDAIKRRTPEG